MEPFQLASVSSPSLVVECGGQRVESVVIKNMKKSPNFPSSVLFLKVVNAGQLKQTHYDELFIFCSEILKTTSKQRAFKPSRKVTFLFPRKLHAAASKGGDVHTSHCAEGD